MGTAFLSSFPVQIFAQEMSRLKGTVRLISAPREREKLILTFAVYFLFIILIENEKRKVKDFNMLNLAESSSLNFLKLLFGSLEEV